MTLAAIISELYDQIRTLKRLKEMAHYEIDVIVRRVDSEDVSISREVHSDELVPGDIIIVPEGNKMPWDAILLEGEWVVNEAMLTGESLPAIKYALPKSNYHIMKDFSIENREEVRIYIVNLYSRGISYLPAQKLFKQEKWMRILFHMPWWQELTSSQRRECLSGQFSIQLQEGLIFMENLTMYFLFHFSLQQLQWELYSLLL